MNSSCAAATWPSSRGWALPAPRDDAAQVARANDTGRVIAERAYVHLSSYDEEAWTWPVPCVRQLLDEGLRFTAPVTSLVGESGSGKSTLVEALAEGFGLDSYGGSHDWRCAFPRAESTLGGRMRFGSGPLSGGGLTDRNVDRL